MRRLHHEQDCLLRFESLAKNAKCIPSLLQLCEDLWLVVSVGAFGFEPLVPVDK